MKRVYVIVPRLLIILSIFIVTIYSYKIIYALTESDYVSEIISGIISVFCIFSVIEYENILHNK
jgi:hypothetical protein